MAHEKTQCSQTFKHYVEVTSIGQHLSEHDKREIKDKGMHKMLKECCGEAVAKASEAQVFPKFCDKKTKKLKMDVFLGDFMTDLAAAVVQNQRKLPKRPDLKDPEVVAMYEKVKGQIAAKHEIKSKPVKVDPVTKRLTDTKLFTGTHKERFDESGRGRGKAGREDEAGNTGYVTGYNNQGTFPEGDGAFASSH